MASRLLDLLIGAAAGSWPPADGRVEVIGAPEGPADAVVAFSAHSVVAADVDPEWVERELRAEDDLTGPMRPDFLARLGARLDARPGSLDVTLAARGTLGSAAGTPELRPLAAGAPEHPRVTRARRYRTEVRAFADPERRGVVICGRGLAGRREVALEVARPWDEAAGVGRELFRAALALVPADEYLFAAVAPGNARSLRAAIAGGFRPVGGEVLFLRS